MTERSFTELLKNYSTAVSDKRRFHGLVRDILPDQALQANLLLILYDMGISSDIETTSAITNAFAFRFVKRLIDEHGVSRVNADWAVSVWCVCYGKNILGKLCEIKISDAASGGSPAISEGVSGRTQYAELFHFKKAQSGGLTVTGFWGENKKTLIIPGRYRDTEVTAIADGAFSESDVQEVIMTDGIKIVGARAFSGCAGLKQVIFPEALLEIGDNSFQGCADLTTASLPRTLEKIGAWAFSSSGIKKAEFPDGIYHLGDGAYSHCVRLGDIVIPGLVERLSDSLFEGCLSLKKVSLPNSLASIGARAFKGCAELTFLAVPDSVTHIGEDAFLGTASNLILQCSPGSETERYARERRINFQLT
jgi:hypothetical protein